MCSKIFSLTKYNLNERLPLYNLPFWWTWATNHLHKCIIPGGSPQLTLEGSGGSQTAHQACLFLKFSNSSKSHDCLVELGTAFQSHPKPWHADWALLTPEQMIHSISNTSHRSYKNSEYGTPPEKWPKLHTHAKSNCCTYDIDIVFAPWALHMTTFIWVHLAMVKRNFVTQLLQFKHVNLSCVSPYKLVVSIK